jgi:hypothetical protein
MLLPWSAFFQGELGAAAALAGLLFVSMSVNQAKILELGRMADRGLEALIILFVVITVSSLPLIPGQPPRLLGGEVLVTGAAGLLGTILLQRAYLPETDAAYRRDTMKMVATNRVAMTLVAVAGSILLWRGDEIGIYVLPVAILLSFFAAGTSAWVLLIEINR